MIFSSSLMKSSLLNEKNQGAKGAKNLQRIEALVALAISFSSALGVEAAELLLDLRADDAQTAEGRLRWCLDLAPVERAHWLSETMSRVRPVEMRLPFAAFVQPAACLAYHCCAQGGTGQFATHTSQSHTACLKLDSKYIHPAL
ncbi:MAG: hypothetical protein WKF84_04050 [Pyrinomonadaceae bacterium]